MFVMDLVYDSMGRQPKPLAAEMRGGSAEPRSRARPFGTASIPLFRAVLSTETAQLRLTRAGVPA